MPVRAYHCEHADLPLPPHHPFPFEKYRETRRRLVEAGVLHADELRPAPAATREQLLRAHDLAFVDTFLAGELDAGQLYDLSRLEEQFNIERWGEDAEAALAAANRKRDLIACETVMRALDEAGV